MQQHLQRQDGVEKVEVNLLDGEVVIFSREDALLRPEIIRQATYDSGVSIRAITITATGWIEPGETGLIFRTGQSQEFSVVLEGDSGRLSHENVQNRLRLRGHLVWPRKEEDSPMKLEIVEILEVP